MESPERILYALKQTKILKAPEELISTSRPTTLHFYVLAEPAYLEVFKNEGPETKIRQGTISWEKPRLLTPGYLLDMEGFSSEAREAMRLLASQHPDLAGILYRMKYKRDEAEVVTVPHTIMEAFRRLERRIEDQNNSFSVVIQGLDELWDVSLMKYVQELILKSAVKSQLPYYESKGFIRREGMGYLVTRSLEGLPLVARQEIEKMFAQVKDGDLDPAVLKQELDRWGVFPAFEDRFFDLFKKE